MLILGLAVAVFAWGLHYKLSLYKSAPVVMQHGSSAEILSNRERPADIAVVVHQATTPVVLPVAFCAGLVLLTLLAADPRIHARLLLQRKRNAERRRVPKLTRHLFFRPPPAIL